MAASQPPSNPLPIGWNVAQTSAWPPAVPESHGQQLPPPPLASFVPSPLPPPTSTALPPLLPPPPRTSLPPDLGIFAALPATPGASAAPPAVVQPGHSLPSQQQQPPGVYQPIVQQPSQQQQQPQQQQPQQQQQLGAPQPIVQQPPAQPPFGTAPAAVVTSQPPPPVGQLLPLGPSQLPPPQQPALAGYGVGLECLASTSFVVVKQRIEPIELLLNFETNNKYDILDPFGRRIYFAAEESSFCCRFCCSYRRTFTMHIYDLAHQEVLRLERPCRLSNPCCCCCQQELQVYSLNGKCIGSVEQTFSCTCRPSYRIQNADGQAVLGVQGPLCTCNACCGDVVFHVRTLSGEDIGSISKKFGGMVREALTDADTFGVTYPADLDVYAKALLLATTLLIDFMYFEDGSSNEILIQ